MSYSTKQIERVISENDDNLRLIISGDNSKTKNLNITALQAKQIANILEDIFVVDHLDDDLEIPVHIKNFENDMIIHIRGYLFNEGEDDENVGLVGFRKGNVYFEISEIEKGDCLKHYFPTTFKDIQTRLIQAAKDKELY